MWGFGSGLSEKELEGIINLCRDVTEADPWGTAFSITSTCMIERTSLVIGNSGDPQGFTSTLKN